MLSRLKNLAAWQPLESGAPAPALSLTADDGTWIRLTDFQDHLHVVLVFFRSAGDDDSRAWLQELEQARPRIEALQALLIGVSTRRTDALREVREGLGLGFPLLYDPLGIDARAFRATSRWRPLLKDTVVVVGKDGRVVHSERGRVPAEDILQALARVEGVAVPEGPVATETGRAAVRMVDSVTAVSLLDQDGSPYILLDVRTLSEFEADHAPQAIHIPIDELPQRYQELGQADHVLCMCQAGERAAVAAEFLASIGGQEIYNVEGGMSGWSGPRVTGGQAQ